MEERTVKNTRYKNWKGCKREHPANQRIVPPSAVVGADWLQPALLLLPCAAEVTQVQHFRSWACVPAVSIAGARKGMRADVIGFCWQPTPLELGTSSSVTPFGNTLHSGVLDGTFAGLRGGPKQIPRTNSDVTQEEPGLVLLGWYSKNEKDMAAWSDAISTLEKFKPHQERN